VSILADKQEKVLIKKSKKGDAQAFEELILSYHKKVLNLAYRMLGSVSDAEDAAQEIFIKVFRTLYSFNERSAFSTWLYKVATNVCLDILRKRKRQNGGAMVSINRYNSQDDEYELPIEDDAPSPYEEAQKKEAMRALNSALDLLSEEQRAVIVMRDINGLSYEEIADVMECSLGTIKSRINRSRLALRKLLEKDKELFIK
jgi:RNA polymerase sigma-70 factor (ECF subfamily)